MDSFGTIRLHHRTIKRFKRFSRKISKSYSETLESIIDFFEWHSISPESRFPKRVDEDGEKTRKRINALIAIVRDIEKTQTLPTNEMLLALFGQHEIVKRKKEPIREETMFKKLTKEEWNKLEKTVPKVEYEFLKQDYKTAAATALHFLERVEWVKPRFGSPYYKVDTDAGELHVLKKRFKDGF